MIVIWKRMNFCMLRYSERPQSTGFGNTTERIVDNRNVARFFGDRCPVAHRKPHLRSIECRGIVRSVSGNGNDLILRLQQTYKSLLIHWTSPSDNFQIGDTFQQSFIVESRKFGPVIILRSPSSGVHNEIWRAISRACGRGIACYDFHFYPRIQTVGNCRRHFLTNRVGNGCDT